MMTSRLSLRSVLWWAGVELGVTSGVAFAYIDGDILGEKEEDLFGEKDGPLLDISLGDSLGDIVGPIVGVSLGNEVGLPLIGSFEGIKVTSEERVIVKYSLGLELGATKLELGTETVSNVTEVNLGLGMSEKAGLCCEVETSLELGL